MNFEGEQSDSLSILSADRIAGLDGTPELIRIWAVAEIDAARLPPFHSVLFGTFRIFDIRILSSAEQALGAPEVQSRQVDIAFGADDGFIAGVHRFSVSEIEGSANSERKRHVTITFAYTSYDLREDIPLGPDVLQTFHRSTQYCCSGKESRTS